MATAWISDSYLYAFILAIAFAADSIGDAVTDTAPGPRRISHHGTAILALFFAIVTAIGYYSALLNSLSNQALIENSLKVIGPILAGVVLIWYNIYKWPILWGLASADAAEERRL